MKFPFCGGYLSASSIEDLIALVLERRVFGSGLSQSVVSVGELTATLDDQEVATFLALNMVATECEELANMIDNEVEIQDRNLHSELTRLQSWEKDLRLMFQEHLWSRFARWPFLFKDNTDVSQGFEVVVYLRCTRGMVRPKEAFPRAPIQWDEMTTVVKGSLLQG